MNDQPHGPSAQINPHTDPLGRCRYCGKQQPSHSSTCRSLAAYWTGNQEERLTAFRAELERVTRTAAPRVVGSFLTVRGDGASHTWLPTGSTSLASRRLMLRRSGVGLRRTPSTNGTATTKTPDSLPSSPLGDDTIGMVAHTPVRPCAYCGSPRHGTRECPYA